MDSGSTTTVLKAIAKLVQPIPGAGDILSALLDVAIDIYEAAEEAEGNREAYRKLAEDIAGYASAVARAVRTNPEFSVRLPGDDGALFEEWTASIKRLNSVFEEALGMILERRQEDERRKGKSSTVTKVRLGFYGMRHRKSDKDRIDEIRSKLQAGLQVFQIDTSGHHYHASERIQDILSSIDHKGAKLLNIAELDRLEQKLTPVNNARFDGEGHPEGCLPNTRLAVLRTIRGWATNRTDTSAVVFCLSGMAGTGKTTIAREICIVFDRFSLGASFFISRSAADRRSAERIVQTIVYQLAIQQQEVSSTVIEALQSSRDITTRPLAEQVEELLIKSLEAWKDTNPPLLLVLDALDECDKVGGREGGDLLPLLVSAVRKLSGRVRLLITSREEPAIMRTLATLGLTSNLNSIRLHHIEDSVVKDDIVLYYTHHLKRISAKMGLGHEASWPSKADFDLLVRRTGKLFVFAALVVRLLNGEWVDPEAQLQQILHSSTSLVTQTAYKDLDELYKIVLEKASSQEKGVDDNLAKRVRDLVGTLLLLHSPQLPETISKLLNEKHFLIKEGVTRLSAVLLVMNDELAPVTIFHPSFADFIFTRCLDERFKVNPPVHHAYLAYRCLVIMNAYLKRDICQIGDPSVMNKDVENLSGRCDKQIPLELRYACEHWTTHLSEANHADEILIKELEVFCKQHLLHWVEVLSLLGRLIAGQQGLPSATSWCKEHILPHGHTVASLLNDLEQTIKTYDLAIEAGALQVYCTCLLFMPRCELYYLTCHEEMVVSSLQLASRRLDGWPTLEKTKLRGHTDLILSVAFSPDGTRVVSGSDNTVRVWDSSNGDILITLEGHDHFVNSVAFSPDGTRIASGSVDATVRVWDSITGIILSTIKGSGEIQLVAFSPDGTHIAFVSDDDTIRVWNSVTGAILSTLEGHTKMIVSVAFSPDGTRIVSGSEDQTARVWDWIASATIITLKAHPHRVTLAAFSPDGTRVISVMQYNTVLVWDSTTGAIIAKFKGNIGSGFISVALSPDGTNVALGLVDNTVVVWDLATGAISSILEGHTDMVHSVAFSPDGTQIASGSRDKTVRVWRSLATSTIHNTLEGHTDIIHSIAFSPDETRVVSGSSDNTIQMWDLSSGAILATLKGHTSWVQSVTFSPDGTRIASGSKDKTVMMWDSATGAIIDKLEGHTDEVWLVEFSPDGTRVASGSKDMTVLVWDSATSAILATLRGHTELTSAFAFSTDGTQIASGSENNSVRVWDPATSAILAILEGHTDLVDSVAFSPDGTRIASSSRDMSIRVWDSSTGTVFAAFQSNGLMFAGPVMFSPDGKHIAFADYVKAQLWNPITNAIIDTLEGVTHTELIWPNRKNLGKDLLSSSFPPAIAFDTDSGWLFLNQGQMKSRKLLCWIPASRRPQYGPLHVWWSRQHIFIATFSGGVTLLSYSVDS